MFYTYLYAVLYRVTSHPQCPIPNQLGMDFYKFSSDLQGLQQVSRENTMGLRYYSIPSLSVALLLATMRCVQSRAHLLTYVQEVSARLKIKYSVLKVEDNKYGRRNFYFFPAGKAAPLIAQWGTQSAHINLVFAKRAFFLFMNKEMLQRIFLASI